MFVNDNTLGYIRPEPAEQEKAPEEASAPFNVERSTLATLYTKATEKTLDTVLQKIWRESGE